MPSRESSNKPSTPPTSTSPTPYQSTISSLFQQPSSKPSLFSKLSAAPSILCDPSKSRISVQVKTDEHGMNDNSWTFFDDPDHVISSREVGTFDNVAIRDDEVCVPRCTDVTFKFYDLSGDGLEGYSLLTFHDRMTDPIIGDYGAEKYNEKTLLIEKDPWASCLPSSYVSIHLRAIQLIIFFISIQLNLIESQLIMFLTISHSRVFAPVTLILHHERQR